MLKIVKSLSDLDIEKLLVLYHEDMILLGQEHFFNHSPFDMIRAAEDSFITYLREDFFKQKDSLYAIWNVQDEYKAALRLQQYNDGLMLDALMTATEERRKGYAINLLSAVQEYLSSMSYGVLYSHIDKRNIASLELHKKCGFRCLRDSARYLDGTVTHNSLTMQYLIKK